MQGFVTLGEEHAQEKQDPLQAPWLSEANT